MGGCHGKCPHSVLELRHRFHKQVQKWFDTVLKNVKTKNLDQISQISEQNRCPDRLEWYVEFASVRKYRSQLKPLTARVANYQWLGHCFQGDTMLLRFSKLLLSYYWDTSKHGRTKPKLFAMTKYHLGEPTSESFDADSISVITSVGSGVLQLQTVYVGNEARNQMTVICFSPSASK